MPNQEENKGNTDNAFITNGRKCFAVKLESGRFSMPNQEENKEI